MMKNTTAKASVESHKVWKHEPIGMTHPAVRLYGVSLE